MNGRPDSYINSEHWRRNCEAAFILRSFPTGDERQAYLDRIARKRGVAHAAELRRTLIHRLTCFKAGIPLPPYTKVGPLDAEQEEWMHDFVAECLR